MLKAKRLAKRPFWQNSVRKAIQQQREAAFLRHAARAEMMSPGPNSAPIKDLHLSAIPTAPDHAAYQRAKISNDFWSRVKPLSFKSPDKPATAEPC